MKARDLRYRRVDARVGSSWRRLVARAGLPLALFALVIQAVVAFGHHHFDPADPHFSDATMIAAMLRSANGASPLRHHGTNSPTEPDDEPCLICMAIYTGATPVVDVPGVVMPVDIGGTLLLAPALSLPSVAWRVAAFEPRGPPLT